MFFSVPMTRVWVTNDNLPFCIFLYFVKHKENHEEEQKGEAI